MSGWRVHDGTALALPRDNIDTDQLIPARFMSQPRAAGYGGFLLYDLRREGEALDPAFPLNRHDASVLVAGRNFGSGSSREAAVYALVDAGFRAVIAPSFGDIFAANAVNNGLLPAECEAEAVARLLRRLETPEPARVDLEVCEIALGGARLPFALPEAWRLKLMRGWDDIDLTLQHRDTIAAHRAAVAGRTPWALLETTVPRGT